MMANIVNFPEIFPIPKPVFVIILIINIVLCNNRSPAVCRSKRLLNITGQLKKCRDELIKAGKSIDRWYQVSWGCTVFSKFSLVLYMIQAKRSHHVEKYAYFVISFLYSPELRRRNIVRNKNETKNSCKHSLRQNINSMTMTITISTRLKIEYSSIVEKHSKIRFPTSSKINRQRAKCNIRTEWMNYLDDYWYEKPELFNWYEM
jgi:hypothetical protein